jgi:uncharacterized protein
VSGLWTILRDGALTTQRIAWQAANVETVRLAVTGLSRAGKTVFLVSLISNLLAMGRGVQGQRLNTLPRLGEVLADGNGGSRLVSVEIEPSGVQRLPRLAYEAYRDSLAGGDEAHWPPFTDQPALLTLRLLLQPASYVGQAKGWLMGPRVIRLELLDYPGEWLVDLPLLEQSYEAWSQETLHRLHEPPRAAMAEPFLAFLAAQRAGAPGSDEVAAHGFRLYRDTLRRCREEAGLRWLQPGRFLMPGPWGEAPYMHFFPWAGDSAPRAGTLGALLRDRFEAYKAEVRSTFFEPHFSAFNRQLVLVDVLGALFAGRTAFEDTREALASIGASYARLLDGGWFGGGWPGGRIITRVAFAATKADHVPGLLRANLRSTLQHMVTAMPAAGAGRSVHAIASVNCTRDATVPVDGRMTPVVIGVPLGEDRQRPFSPGLIPAGEVPESYWEHAYFVMPQLRPPEFRAGDAYPIPHLNLDEVLVALLGDVL